MAITSRQGFADYLLRQMGAPVVNVEVDPQQLEDCIENALQYYKEYYYDGTTKGYLTYKLVGTTITVLDATGFNVNGTITSADRNSIRAQIYTITGNTIVVHKQVGYTKFKIGDVITDGSNSTTITDIVIGDLDNEFIPCPDPVMAVNRILNISSILGTGDYMFNIQYQIMLNELNALTKSGVASFYETMNYLSHINFILKKEKSFTFNRRINRLYLEISWGNEIKAGDIIVAEVENALDEEVFSEVYDDIWLKKYGSALLKKQLGTNLKKYTGMQLPGGLTYNGQQIFNEAIDDIKELEEFAMNNYALGFEVG